MLKIPSFVTSVLLLLGWAMISSAAHASTVCNFASNPGVAFGVYDDTSSSPRDTTANIIINCTRNGGPPNLTVTLSLGTSSTSGSINPRYLGLGMGSNIAYNLYRDSSRGLIWGQTPGADTITQSLSIPNKSTASVTFTIFGRITELQSASVGNYSDSIIATVFY